MPSTYHLTEPFPNPTRQYAFTGRGGAGNFTRNRPSTTTFTEPSATAAINNLCLIQSQEPYPPPKTLQTSTSTTTRPSLLRKTYIFGRGGFGNTHPSAERAMFSFDEELERASKTAESMAPIYHIGRGGQGNIVVSDASSRNSSAASSTGTSSSSSTTISGGVRGGFMSSLDKVRAHFSRQNSYYN